MTKDNVWRKATDTPPRGFSGVMRYFGITGDKDEFLKHLAHNKSKKISGILLLGSMEPLERLIWPL